jgi:hypothetical protein
MKDQSVKELQPVEVTVDWLRKMFEGMEYSPGFVLNIVVFDTNGLPAGHTTVGKNISADRRSFYADAMYLASQEDAEKQRHRLLTLPQPKKSARILKFKLEEA